MSHTSRKKIGVIFRTILIFWHFGLDNLCFIILKRKPTNLHFGALLLCKSYLIVLRYFQTRYSLTVTQHLHLQTITQAKLPPESHLRVSVWVGAASVTVCRIITHVGRTPTLYICPQHSLHLHTSQLNLFFWVTIYTTFTLQVLRVLLFLWISKGLSSHQILIFRYVESNRERRLMYVFCIKHL